MNLYYKTFSIYTFIVHPKNFESLSSFSPLSSHQIPHTRNSPYPVSCCSRHSPACAAHPWVVPPCAIWHVDSETRPECEKEREREKEKKGKVRLQNCFGVALFMSSSLAWLPANWKSKNFAHTHAHTHTRSRSRKNNKRNFPPQKL